MAILQSRIFLFLYRVANQGESRVIPQIKAAKLEELPFPSPAAIRPRTRSIEDRVERMLELHKQLGSAKTDHVQTNLQRQIDETDSQIDKLVYELYGLSDDEITIVKAVAV